MSIGPLRYLSEARLIELRKAVPDNLDRYATGDFRDLSSENGWAIESMGVKVRYDRLHLLDPSSTDVWNSEIVYSAFEGMNPAVAAEERVWTRLTHIECLEYARARWLAGHSGDRLRAAVELHVFAPGRTGLRDDNAISRLWWNRHIAGIADPDDPGGALKLIARRADIRQAFVERPGTAARQPLAKAVLRVMKRNVWLTAREAHFRVFMKVLNREGGGILFEVLTDRESDVLMDRFAHAARVEAEFQGVR